jgi:hypothetical protein
MPRKSARGTVVREVLYIHVIGDVPCTSSIEPPTPISYLEFTLRLVVPNHPLRNIIINYIFSSSTPIQIIYRNSRSSQ